MLIKHMAACLVATALVAAPALAQNVGDRPAASDNRTGTLGSPTQNAPGTMAPTGSSSSTMGGATGAGSTAQAPAPTPPAPPPSPSASTPPAPPAGGSTAMGGTMQNLQQGQFLASDLIGTRVVGQNNESIGDVNDVVMGRDGKAMAVIVGVGGFLGIGEKDVAIPFEQAQISFDAGGTGNNAAGGAGTPNATGSTGTAGTTGGTTATTGAQQSAASNEPQRIVINMTKEQLQQAPAFRSSGSNTESSGSGNAGSGGSGTAPRQ
jgi:sporulation protein YlmC with PRC-barrel domain